MHWHRFRLEQRSGALTPWQADTLIGHFAWEILRNEGLAALRAFLDAFLAGEPPFVLSDGFPGDLLPAPMSLPWLAPDAAAARELAKHPWLTPDEFDLVRAGRLPPALIETPPRRAWQTAVVPHVALSRVTATSGGEGSLYALEERHAVGPDGAPADVTFYALAADAPAAARLADLFERLSRSGYGKRKSIGKGAFRLREAAPFGGFAEVKGDAAVALANFVPAAADPPVALWRVGLKQGRLGEERAHRAQPFKRPYRFLAAGAVLRGPVPRPWVGRPLKGLSSDPDDPGRPGDDVQVCIAPVLPCAWPPALAGAAEAP